MAHVPVPHGVPGIIGLMKYRPETAAPLNALAEVLLRGPSTLSRGERELIAALVSTRNECTFCASSHAAFASAQLEGGRSVTDAVQDDHRTAPVSDKLKALFEIALQVQRSGRNVTPEAVAAARALGATDVEIHDTVLIAAAFCMYNRYVDGLGTFAPTERAAYDEIAQVIVRDGYQVF